MRGFEYEVGGHSVHETIGFLEGRFNYTISLFVNVERYSDTLRELGYEVSTSGFLRRVSRYADETSRQERETAPTRQTDGLVRRSSVSSPSVRREGYSHRSR